MMYSEFVAGTGCKDNEHNYKVFQDLEIMYMNSNLTKNEIYEYGKKLVNNSKSEKEIKFEAEIKAQIEDLKETIRFYQEQLEMYKTFYSMDNDKAWKHNIQNCKMYIKEAKQKIQGLKWVLA